MNTELRRGHRAWSLRASGTVSPVPLLSAELIGQLHMAVSLPALPAFQPMLERFDLVVSEDCPLAPDQTSEHLVQRCRLEVVDSNDLFLAREFGIVRGQLQLNHHETHTIE